MVAPPQYVGAAVHQGGLLMVMVQEQMDGQQQTGDLLQQHRNRPN